MHRVVNLVSIGNDSNIISTRKEEIKNQLSQYSNVLYVSEVNDGTNEEENPTLAVNADFNNATDANNFHDWLKNYIQQNSSDFIMARTRIHDCYHAAGENMPCVLGDVWSLDNSNGNPTSGL